MPTSKQFQPRRTRSVARLAVANRPPLLPLYSQSGVNGLDKSEVFRCGSNQGEIRHEYERKSVKLFALLASASGLVLCVPAVSADASPKPPASTSANSESGMYVAGFDKAVAKAHGYKIVTLANGDQQSVPISAKSGLPKGPVLHKATKSKRAKAAANTDYAAVYGNCGQSWIRTTQVGTNKVSVASGYRYLPEPAYYWSWEISLTDQNGTSRQRYSGATSGTSASRVWSNLNQYGYSYDRVAKGGATLNSGTICFSGNPDVRIDL